jgi:hypothetical protein
MNWKNTISEDVKKGALVNAPRHDNLAINSIVKKTLHFGNMQYID